MGNLHFLRRRHKYWAFVFSILLLYRIAKIIHNIIHILCNITSEKWPKQQASRRADYQGKPGRSIDGYTILSFSPVPSSLTVLLADLHDESQHNSDEPNREEWLRNSFEFAYVTQFLSLFYFAFGLDSFSYHELETLLLWEPDQVTGNTTNFFKRILKALPNARVTATDNWIHVLGKEYRKHGVDKPFEEPEIPTVDPDLEDGEPAAPPAGLSLADLDLKTRIQILYDMCEFHMRHVQHFTEVLLKGVDAGQHWRFEPMGRDANGLQYWLFDDGRLFREETEAKGSLIGVKDTWELVCTDRDSWRRFLDEELSKKPADRKLKESLMEEWEVIDATLLEQEKIAKKKSRELSMFRLTHDLIPRKRSSRIQAKEAMQKLKEQEEAEEQAARRKAEAEARKAAGKPPLPEVSPAIGGRGMSREERAEQRRLRLEREAEEKVLRELEEERRRNEPTPPPEPIVDIEETEAVKEPLKIVIRRSSITGEDQPPKKPKVNKKKEEVATQEKQHQQRVLSLMEQAIQRELAQRMKTIQPQPHSPAHQPLVHQQQHQQRPPAGYPMPYSGYQQQQPMMMPQQAQMGMPFVYPSPYGMQPQRPQYQMPPSQYPPMPPRPFPQQMTMVYPNGHNMGQMQGGQISAGHMPAAQMQPGQISAASIPQQPLRPQAYMPRPMIQELQQEPTSPQLQALPTAHAMDMNPPPMPPSAESQSR